MLCIAPAARHMANPCGKQTKCEQTSAHHIESVHFRYTQTRMDPMRTSKLRYQWNFLNGLLFQPTVAFDVFKMDMRYLSLKGLQVLKPRPIYSWMLLSAISSLCWTMCAIYVRIP